MTTAADHLKYTKDYKKRDPSGIRTAWLLELLKVRPHSRTEIANKAMNTNFGFAPSTYTTDLQGLKLNNMIFLNGRGLYEIDTAGCSWLYNHKKAKTGNDVQRI